MGCGKAAAFVAQTPTAEAHRIAQQLVRPLLPDEFVLGVLRQSRSFRSANARGRSSPHSTPVSTATLSPDDFMECCGKAAAFVAQTPTAEAHRIAQRLVRPLLPDEFMECCGKAAAFVAQTPAAEAHRIAQQLVQPLLPDEFVPPKLRLCRSTP